jgi:nitrite reductase/ring-hydroxylating ferredoxin subunit
MELPDNIKAVGQQLEAGGAVSPEPEFFTGYDVFRAETALLCVKPWLAVDHASRLAEDGDYFRVDIGSRSVVVVREAADKIYALRNACLHAGYRVCDEEEGKSDSLFCKYHGWSYALDGSLTDPLLRPEEKDRSRYRLPRFAMAIERGLIFVDASVAKPEAPQTEGPALDGLPAAIAEWPVAGRARYPAAMNWKYLRQLLWSAKELALGGRDPDAVIEFGPLSYVAWRGDSAALLRLNPRFPGQSEFEVIRLGAPAADGGNGDALAEALRRTGDAVTEAPLAVLERGFYDWYWAALDKPEAA